MFRALRNHNYRLFVSGGLLSAVGTWMQRTAQDWLVLDLTGGSGSALGLTVALQYLPMLVFGLWGGMLADRYPKRRVLVVVQTLLGLLAMAMGVLVLTGMVAVWHVFVMAFGVGLLSCVEVPTRQSFVVEMVGRRDLPNAIALNASMFNLARVAGPALAGVLIYWMGTGPIFLLNALSFGAVISGLLLMRTSELRTPEPVPRAKGQLRESLRYVVRRPDLLLPVLVVACMAISIQSFSASIALMAKQVFGAGASSFGIASSAFAVGAFGGALLAARRVTPSPRFLIAGAVCFGLFQIAAGLAPGYWVFLGLLVPAGMAMITTNTTANTILQLGTSPAMRGRVMGMYLLVMTSGAPIGAPLLGWLAEHAGTRFAVGVVGALSVTGVALAVLATRISVARANGRQSAREPTVRGAVAAR